MGCNSAVTCEDGKAVLPWWQMVWGVSISNFRYIVFSVLVCGLIVVSHEI